MRRLQRTALWLGAWLLAGAAALWLYADAHLHPPLVGLVETPALPIAPLEDARLTRLLVTPGQPVQADDPIAQLSDTHLRARLHTLQRRRDELQRRLEDARRYARADNDLQRQRLLTDQQGYARDLLLDATQRREQRALLDALERRIQRIQPAAESGALPQLQLQDLLDQRATLRAALAPRLTPPTAPDHLPDPPDDGALLRALLDTQDELAELEQQRRNTTLRAPQEGTITAVLAFPGAPARAFEPVAILQPGPPRVVEVYLPEELHVPLKPGDRATVRSPRLPAQPLLTVVAAAPGPVLPLPERLLTHPQQPRWGRTVRLLLPEAHPLLPGERVAVEVEGAP